MKSYLRSSTPSLHWLPYFRSAPFHSHRPYANIDMRGNSGHPRLLATPYPSPTRRTSFGAESPVRICKGIGMRKRKAVGPAGQCKCEYSALARQIHARHIKLLFHFPSRRLLLRRRALPYLWQGFSQPLCRLRYHVTRRLKLQVSAVLREMELAVAVHEPQVPACFLEPLRKL